MYLIAGLGNPGKEYAKTRHNMGYEALDRLIVRHAIPQSGTKCRAMIGKGTINGQKVLLAKPLTYMNGSGEAIRGLCDYYKIDPVKELIVLVDDIHLPCGRIRIRPEGSDGGHNGLKNIISHLGTEAFTRIRIGVGEKAEGKDLIDHVLKQVSKEDEPFVAEAVERTADAVEVILLHGVDEAMNRFNGIGKTDE